MTKENGIELNGNEHLADCAVDGKIPKGNLQTKEQMQQELIKWLERLERNEISTFERKNLDSRAIIVVSYATRTATKKPKRVL